MLSYSGIKLRMNRRGIVGSGIFYAVRPEAIQQGPMEMVEIRS
jgi:hypothetical protein